MCPDLFHFYSALFRQCRATTPSYGTKIIIFGHLGSFWGANRPPWPEKRFHCIAPGVPGKSKRCVLLQHHIETNRNYSNLFPKSNWGRQRSHTGFIEEAHCNKEGWSSVFGEMRRASHVSASVTATSYSLMPHHHQFTSLPIGQRTRAFSYSLSPCFSSQVNRPQAMRGNYCTCSCSFASMNEEKMISFVKVYCHFNFFTKFLIFCCFQNEI